jgi:hypothetical protein
MDERTLKRLLIMVAVSIIAIVLFKTMLVKTAVKVNKAIVEKKQATSAKPPAEQQAQTPPPAATASAVVGTTTMDTLASSHATSSVSEAR